MKLKAQNILIHGLVTYESNNFDGLGGDDELIGGWVNDVISGGSGDDRISGTLGANVLDGGDGFGHFKRILPIIITLTLLIIH